MATIEHNTSPATTDAHAVSGFERIISSVDLLDGARTVTIEHDGEHYRLRHTKRGKLILTK